jgi:tetratricopeptide (TPR) repeat protein
VVAGQALGHAVTAGDWPLALRAARVLEAKGALLPDVRFLLLADAFHTRDWRGAQRQIDAIERDRLFAFSVPVLRAWLAFGSRRGDPVAELARATEGPAAGYAAEHRPLILLAQGRAEGAAELAQAAETAGPRAPRLRIAGAAALARRDRAAALGLLQGDTPSLQIARSLLDARRPLPGAIDSAETGMAEFLVKLSIDLNSNELASVSATLARLATWLAPDSSETWMVAAEFAARQDRHAAAIAMLTNVPAGDPFAAVARDQRIRLLVDGDDKSEALREAEAAAALQTASAADQVRLGEVLMSLDRPADAAGAFARAIATRDDATSNYPEWALWLMRGGAHDEAGQWPEARAALERAYSLAPDQPLVLNYLGYSQLARRENMLEAERLIREAHRLAPDNAAITDSLGWALFLKGERDEGIQLLEQAVVGAPADTEINEHLGDAYYAVGRRMEARYAWRAARVYAEGEDASRLDSKIAQGMTAALAAR